MDPNQMRQKPKFFQVKISDCSLPEAGRTKRTHSQVSEQDVRGLAGPLCSR